MSDSEAGWHFYKGMMDGIDTVSEHYRIDRESMFMMQAAILRLRSTCKRGKVGCVAVQDNRIVAMGYNGAPAGQPHCLELGCDMDANNHDAGCQRTIHAEANCIVWAARTGISLEGGTLYSTHGPCLKCAQLIIQAGFAALVYDIPYRLSNGLDLLDRASIPVRQYGVAR